MEKDVISESTEKGLGKISERFSKIKDIISEYSSFSAELKNEVKENLLEYVNKMIEKNPKILYFQDKSSKQNLVMLCARAKIEEIVLKYIENEKIALQQDFYGMTVGMYAADKKLKKATLLALDNEKASTIQDKNGMNIGMHCAVNKFEAGVMKALENPQASHQQDKNGNNIGMICAKNKMEKATIKALENNISSWQQNAYGYNIGMYAAENNLKKAVKVAVKNNYAYNQKNILGQTMSRLTINNAEDALSFFRKQRTINNFISKLEK